MRILKSTNGLEQRRTEEIRLLVQERQTREGEIKMLVAQGQVRDACATWRDRAIVQRKIDRAHQDKRAAKSLSAAVVLHAWTQETVELCGKFNKYAAKNFHGITEGEMVATTEATRDNLDDITDATDEARAALIRSDIADDGAAAEQPEDNDEETMQAVADFCGKHLLDLQVSPEGESWAPTPPSVAVKRTGLAPVPYPPVHLAAAPISEGKDPAALLSAAV